MYDDFYVIILPAGSGERRAETLAGLRKAGFSRFLRAGGEAGETPGPGGEEPGVTVLNPGQNAGRGTALKAAFRRILRDGTAGLTGVVVLDEAGCYRPEDAAAVADAVRANPGSAVLGRRDFSDQSVPEPGRFGNTLTRLAFRLLCGIRVSDPLTGLRGFPVSALPLLAEIGGKRVEYETNMLPVLKRNRVPIAEIPVRPAHPAGGTARFRPVRDSLRVFGFFFGYVSSSVFSFALDLLLFYLLRRLLAPLLGTWTILIATAAARAVSSFTNFTVNRKRVFGFKAHPGRAMARYYAVAVPQMFVSAGLVHLISRWIGGSSGKDTWIKIAVDFVLFFVVYRLQQSWVFAEPKQAENP